MKEIEFGNFRYIVGLDFKQEINKKEYTKRLLSYSKDNPDVKYSVVSSFKDSIAIGLIHGESKKPKLNSAIAHLACANGVEYEKILNEQIESLKQSELSSSSKVIESITWIYIDQISEEEYWLGIVHNGLPMQNGDLVGDYETIREELLLQLTNLQNISDIINIYVGKENLRFILNAQDGVNYYNIFTKDFNDLVLQTKYTAKVVRNTKIHPMIPKTAIGLFVVLLGYWGYNSYSEYLIEQAKLIPISTVSQEDLRKIAQNKLDKYEKEKKESIKAQVDKYTTVINQTLSYPNFANVLKEWTNIIYRQPSVESVLWTKVNAQCSLTKDLIPVCNITYRRLSSPDGVGTVEAFLKRYPTAVFAKGGDEATVSFNGVLLNAENASYQNTREAETFRIYSLSKLQALAANNIQKKLTDPVLIQYNLTIPPPPKGVLQDINISKLNFGISKGTFGLSGNGLFYLNSLGYELKDYGLQLTEMKVNFSNSGDGRWEVTGNLFVKSGVHNIQNLKIPQATIRKFD